jgi:putative addiction module killer protein
MIEMRQTAEFSRWMRRQRDANAVARIVARIRRKEQGARSKEQGARSKEQGNLGDSKSLGAGLMEMRIDYGPGYRIYYVHRGATIIILLCAGDKRTQRQDIKRARKLVEKQ